MNNDTQHDTQPDAQPPDIREADEHHHLRRRPERFAPEHRRVITRMFLPGGPERIHHTIDRVMGASEAVVVEKLDEIIREFEHRHRRFRRALGRNAEAISRYVSPEVYNAMSEERKLFLGACFTHEYSVSAAAMFNPSIVPAPDQSDVPEGSLRIIISFRATGEGHISSVEFRSGIVDPACNIHFDPISPFLESPEISPDHSFENKLFRMKLQEIGLAGNLIEQVLDRLTEEFTMDDLIDVMSAIRDEDGAAYGLLEEGLRSIHWLAESNYTVRFPSEHSLSERVLFPVSDNERQGIEDARFVRFVDDGDATFVATYTAYNGVRILPQLIETKDFITFKVSTLNGAAVENKGMALFPRKVKGEYVMLGRQDGENNYIMFSDNLHFWQEKEILTMPRYSWEFIQVGNNGSPIETERGWLVITHGVGPMRKYCLGCLLLDLDDPRKVIARSRRPILCPNVEERDGYVPNVVYTCGVLVHNGQLLIPYAMSDSISGFATLPLDSLLDSLETEEE